MRLTVFLLCIALVLGCRDDGTVAGGDTSAGGESRDGTVMGGVAVALSVEGPPQVRAGECSGPFVALAIDDKGNRAGSLADGATLEIPLVSGVEFFNDAACADAISLPGTVNFDPELRVTFFLRALSLSPLVVATRASGMPASFSFDVSPGRPANIVLGLASTVLTNSCAAISFTLKDDLGNVSPATDAQIEWRISNHPQASVFAEGTCETPIESISFNRTGRRDLFFRASSAGTARIDLIETAGMNAGPASVNIVDPIVPELHLSVPGGSAVVGDFVPLRIDVRKPDGSPFVSEAPVEVELGGASFFAAASEANPLAGNRALVVPPASFVQVFVRHTVVGRTILTASTPGYVDGRAEKDWEAGAPALVVIESRPQSPTTGELNGPVSVGLRDVFGNPRPVSAALTLSLSASGEAAAGSSFHASAESIGNRISELTIPIGSSTGLFFFRTVLPGNFTVGLSAPGLASLSFGFDVEGAAVPPPDLKLTAAEEISAGVCSAVTVASVRNNAPAPVIADDLPFSLNSTSAEGKFFEDSGCEIEKSTSFIAAGRSERIVYFLSTKKQNPVTLIAEAAARSASLALAVRAAAISQLTLTSQAANAMYQCTIVSLDFADRFGNAAELAPGTVATIDTNGKAIVSSSPDCEAMESPTIASPGGHSLNFHVRPLVKGTFPVTVSGVTADPLSFNLTGLDALPILLALSVPAGPVRAGDCVSFQIVNTTPEVTYLPEPLVLGIGLNSVDAAIYGSGCAERLSPAQISVTSLRAPGGFAFRSTRAGEYALSVTGPNGLSLGAVVQVDPNVPKKLLLASEGSGTLARSRRNGPYFIDFQDAHGNATSGEGVPITLRGLPEESAVFQVEPAGGESPERATFYILPSDLGILDVEVSASGLTSASRNFQVENDAELAFFIEDSPTSELSFGEVVVNEERTLSLSLKNKSAGLAAREVRLIYPFSHFQVDPGTSTCPEQSETFAPSRTCDVAFKVKPLEPGTFVQTMTVSYVDLEGPKSVALNLRVSARSPRPASLTVSPAAFDFGKVTIGESRELLGTLTNSGELTPANLTLSTAVAGVAVALADGCELTAGNSCPISLRYTPLAKPDVSGALSLSYDGTVSDAAQISGQPQQKARLVADTSAIDFGVEIVGRRKALIRSFTNTGDLPTGALTVTKIGDAFTAGQCAVLAAGETCNLSVEFAPEVSGSVSGLLRVEDSSSSANAIEVSLLGQGRKIIAPMVDPVAITFDLTLRTKTSERTLVVTNSGDTAYASLTAQVTGTDADEYSVDLNGCTGLAPQSSCLMKARFSPQSAGIKSAAFIVSATSEGEVKASPSIPLLGTASNGAELSLNPSSIDFGNVIVNEEISRVVTVRNTGPVNASLVSFTLPLSAYRVLAESTCGSSLEVGRECVYLVGFKPGAAGALNGNASLTVNNGVEERTFAIAITGAGVAQGRLSTTTATIAFGTLAAGQLSGVKSLSLKNVGTHAVQGITPLLPAGITLNASNCPESLGVNKSCTISFKLLSVTEGAYAEPLPISFGPQGAPPIVQTLSQFTATIVPASVLIADVASVDFGTLFVGVKSASRKFTITNTGIRSTTAMSVMLPPGMTSSGCTGSLGASATCSLTVYFTPDALGPAALPIVLNYTNTLGAQTLAFSASANVVEHPILLPVEAISLGEVKKGVYSDTVTVSVTNTGPVDLRNVSMSVSGSSGASYVQKLPSLLAPGVHTFTFRIRTNSLGAFNASLNVKYYSVNAYRTLAIPISATIIP